MNQDKSIRTIFKFIKNRWRLWTILVFLVIIIYLGVVFYKYVYVPIYSPQEAVSQRLEIKENIYDILINKLSQQEKNISEIFNKNYLNPFK
ncbi:MAG: hypothetical protein V1686_01455 [Patescibacteria group bacterium]